MTDGSNHYVTDLGENEFSVFEDGVKQNITFFSRRQQPIALSLLLDSSASMEQHLGTLQTAATNFIKKLKPNDIAQVIDFDSRVEIRQGFTGNQADLADGDRTDQRRRLDIAAQRDLHRAQGAAEGQGRAVKRTSAVRR